MRSVFENGANLFKRDARKPLHKLGNLCAVLEVLKQRSDGHARAAKHPCSTNTL